MRELLNIMSQEISSTTNNRSGKPGLWFVLLTGVHLLALLMVRSPVASLPPLSWLALDKGRSSDPPTYPKLPFTGRDPAHPSKAISNKFTAHLLAVDAPPVSEQRDAPENWPTVNTRQQTHTTDTSSCTLASANPWYFGKIVKLRVTIDDRGSVLGNYTTVVDSSGASQGYQELVQCLANHWEFQPASEAGKPLYSNAYIKMRVDRF